MTDGEVEAEFVVGSPLGLHARPAGRFVSLAGRFHSEVQVTRDNDGLVCGRSLLSLLSLAAAQGTKLRIRAVGEDAHAAVAALGRLIESSDEEASA